MPPSPSPTATHEWKKTSTPVCYFDKSTGKWRLFLNYTSQRGTRSKRRGGPPFDSREEALAAMLDFRMSFEYSLRGKLFKRTEKDACLHSAGGAAVPALPAGKTLFSLGKLGAAQEAKYKRQRFAGSKRSRAEFAMEPMLSQRQHRSLARGGTKRETKLRKDFKKRGNYLGSRISELTTRLAFHEQDVLRLERALAEERLGSLLASVSPQLVEDGLDADERGRRDGEQTEDIPATQAKRLRQQGSSVLAVLKEELRRDLEQLKLTQAAKALSEQSLPTDAAVKEADAKRWELLNEASLIRHSRSLLRIAADVNSKSPGTRSSAASTVLRWVRDFRTQGGFKRDTRGKHKRDMS